jgi:hypothetical protein
MQCPTDLSRQDFVKVQIWRQRRSAKSSWQITRLCLVADCIIAKQLQHLYMHLARYAPHSPGVHAACKPLPQRIRNSQSDSSITRPEAYTKRGIEGINGEVFAPKCARVSPVE